MFLDQKKQTRPHIAIGSDWTRVVIGKDHARAGGRPAEYPPVTR